MEIVGENYSNICKTYATNEIQMLSKLLDEIGSDIIHVSIQIATTVFGRQTKWFYWIGYQLSVIVIAFLVHA